MPDNPTEKKFLSYKAPSMKWRNLSIDSEADTEQQGAQEKEVRESKEKLKETLLASMQMQNLVVLVGSGCSQSAGGPSMQDLWEASIGVRPSEAIQKVAAIINFDLGSPNIEALLSKAEAFLQVKEEAAIKTLVNDCKKVILEKCSSFMGSDKLMAHKTFLHRLSRRRVRDQRLKVFTTNYDLCFEKSASELGGVALDGFSFAAPRKYDPRYFGYDIIRRPRGGEDLGNYLEGVFLLYKLHGSVNWARSTNDIFEKSNPTPDEACLIYPATGKYQQSFLQPHLESMSQYLTALREPNTCLIVVGFGFNDDHLSEPLLAAVRSNPHLRLIIADLNARQRDKANRYWQELILLNERGDDIWFLNASFQEFSELIPDLKSLTPADRLMRTIQGVTRNE